MSFLEKKIWLPKTLFGKFFLSVIVLLVVVYVTTVTSRFIENGYTFSGDFVCTSGFEGQIEYVCPLWYTGVVAIENLFVMVAFMSLILMPLLAPLTIVWLIKKGSAVGAESRKVNFAPGQKSGSQSGIVLKIVKFILYAYIAFIAYRLSTVIF